MKKTFVNGKIVPSKKAVVSVMDRGFLYGDGVFETMRAYGGSVFCLGEHVNRMLTALKILKIRIPYDKKTLCRLVEKTVRVNRLKDAYVKIVVTRGPAAPGIDPSAGSVATVIIFAAPLKALPRKYYTVGVSVEFPCVRRNEESFTARIKSLNYLDNILARHEVRGRGAYEPVFLNSKGNVTETSTANVFIVRGDRVYTPPPTAGILPGITREVVMRLAGKYLDNKLIQKDISKKEFLSADEIFLTNSIGELIPVVKAGGRKIGTGRPGPFFKFLRIVYNIQTGNI